MNELLVSSRVDFSSIEWELSSTLYLLSTGTNLSILIKLPTPELKWQPSEEYERNAGCAARASMQMIRSGCSTVRANALARAPHLLIPVTCKALLCRSWCTYFAVELI
jgi:hypothetical protein